MVQQQRSLQDIYADFLAQTQAAGGNVFGNIPGTQPGATNQQLLDPAYFTALYPYLTYAQTQASNMAMLTYQEQQAAARASEENRMHMQIAQMQYGNQPDYGAQMEAQIAGQERIASLQAQNQIRVARMQGEIQERLGRIAADNDIRVAKMVQAGRMQEAMLNAQTSRDAIASEAANVRARIQADMQVAQMGGQIDVDKFNANMQYLAGLANEDRKMQVAQMAGSGKLVDTLSARQYMAGTGQQPGQFSAFDLGGPPREITAPQIAMPRFGGGVGGGVGAPAPAPTPDVLPENRMTIEDILALAGPVGSMVPPMGPERTPAEMLAATSGGGEQQAWEAMSDEEWLEEISRSGREQTTINNLRRANADMPQTAQQWGAFKSREALPDWYEQAVAAAERRNPYGLARGTKGVGEAYLVGDGAGIIPGVTEVLHKTPKGKVEVIPLAGAAQGGLDFDYNQYLTGGTSSLLTGETKSPGYDWNKLIRTQLGGTTGGTTQQQQQPAGGGGGSTININVPGQSGGFNLPADWQRQSEESARQYREQQTAEAAAAAAPPAAAAAAPAAGPMDALRLLPAYQALTEGKRYPAFGPFGGPLSAPGIGQLPFPMYAASRYMGASPLMQSDILDLYQYALGPAGREEALWQIMNATPGFRRNQQRAFTFG